MVKTELLSIKASGTENRECTELKETEKKGFCFCVHFIILVCYFSCVLGVVFLLLAFNSQALNNLVFSDSGPNSY